MPAICFNAKNSTIIAITWLAATSLSSCYVYAQQIIANGISVTVPANTIVDTGIKAGASGGYGLLATNNGQINSQGPLIVKTGGASAHAVYMQRGATSQLENASIFTTGNGSHGLDSFGVGSVITLTDSIISTAGNSAYGVRGVGGGHINLKNTTVSTAGNGSYGVEVTGAESAIFAEGVQITTIGDMQLSTRSAGAVAEGSAKLTILNSDTVISSINTTGNNAFGALSQSGGQLYLTGDYRKLNIGTSGTNAAGLWVQNENSLAQLTNVHITTSGDQSQGVVGYGSGARADLFGGQVETTGAQSVGIYSDGAAIRIISDFAGSGTAVNTAGNLSDGLKAYIYGTITAENVAVVTGGEFSRGARAEYFGNLNLFDSSFSTTGNASYGLSAFGKGASIFANNITVNTSGDNIDAESSNGIVAEFGGRIAVAGESYVTTTGHNANGLLSQAGGDPSQTVTILTFTGVPGSKVTTIGDDAHGAEACSLTAATDKCTEVFDKDVAGIGAIAVLNVDGVKISTQGNAAYGLYAYGQSASVSAENVAVSTSGKASHGTVLRNGGSITLADSTISTNGLEAAGLYIIGSDTVEGSATFSNVMLNTDQGSSIVVAGGTGDIALTNVQAAVNDGLWLDVQQSTFGTVSVANITAESTELKGAALTSDMAQSNVTLAGGTTWEMTASSNLTSLVNTESKIAFSSPSDTTADHDGYKTLTVGSYTGQDGYLSINTALGNDGSLTDMLVVTGDATGTTTLVVNNAGGTGAQTTEGIKVIEVGGVSTGEFNLLGDYAHEGKQAVIAGAYAYKLYQGGISTPTDGDWYLRSQLDAVPPVDPTDPDPELPEGPLYQAGVPSYEAYPQVLLGLNGVATLQQRVGNRFWSGNGNRVIAQGADPVGSPYAAPREAGVVIEGNGVWGRIEGLHTHIDPRQSTSATDYDQNVFKLQAGLDGMLMESEGGKLIGGVTVHYAHGKTKTSSVHGDGEITTDGYGFGSTLTWYGENGFYLDSQGQLTWYRSDLNSSLAQTGLTDGNHGFGYALSLEGGKRIALNQAWSVTPQAQLSYSNVNFDAFTDRFDARVSLDRGESLQGRLGLTLDHENSWQNTNGMLNRAHVYGIANLYYEFLENTRVNVAETRFTSQNERLWGGIGMGGSYNWNGDKYSIYGEGLVNTSLNNFGDSYAIKGNVGFRVKW